jgi:hypothetical protein
MFRELDAQFVDNERRRQHEKASDDLVLQYAIPTKGGARRIDKENAEGFAVPDVSVHDIAREDGPTGVEIKFIVDMRDRVSKLKEPGRERDEQQNRKCLNGKRSSFFLLMILR